MRTFCIFALHKKNCRIITLTQTMDIVNVLKSSVISGICIGVAGIGFLATRDIVGSVLFAFALLTVVAYKLKLYTGTAGFIKKG